MSFEVTVLGEEDIPSAVSISSYAFNAPNRDYTAYVERARRVSRPDWYLGSFEDGEMTSMMQMIPVDMHLNGGTIAVGAVSPVASSPLHRRKGHAGQMLRRSLELMKQRGQAVSALTTPHPALYRRYGWEIAADVRRYSFKPKDFRQQQLPIQSGRFRLLTSADWRELDGIYQRFAEKQNGPFRRDETWWRDYVLELPWDPISDIVLWENDSGGAEGYALYKQPLSGDEHRLIVRELIAISGDAYLNLLTYFARHDLYDEITLRSSVGDVLPLVFADAERLEVRDQYAVMLRVCDFEEAMRQRSPARNDETSELTLRIEDADASWNEGTWRIGVAEGKTWVEKTSATPELTLQGRILGPLFNGYARTSTLSGAGLIEPAAAKTLERADRIFAARERPFFIDTF